MKRCLSTAINPIALVVVLLASAAAAGADLKVISAIGMQEVMEDLGPKFERATGHKLTIVFATLSPALKRIEGGETADVIVLPAQGIDRLVKDGKAGAGDVKTVARSQVGVAVRKGTPEPDISSPEAFKQPCRRRSQYSSLIPRAAASARPTCSRSSNGWGLRTK